METRAKLPKKVLSMFLSLLMALSCFSVALPGIAPIADASTTAQWTALQNAFDAAELDSILTGANAASSKSGTSYTINDTSSKGHLYKIADLLYAIVQSDYASYTHHERMSAYIKGKLSLNSYQQDFVDKLLPSPDNYTYSSSSDALSTGWNKGGYPANPLSGNITVTVTITRSLDAAIAMDCATAADVPGSINTTLKYSVTATPQSANNGTSTSSWTSTYKDGSKDKSTTVTDTYYKTKGWYTNSGAPSVSYTKTNCPDLSAIVSYLNYVNTESFQEGYTAWRSNPTIVYSWDIEVLEAIQPNYKPYSDALASVDAKYIDTYIGSTQKGLYDEYAGYCTGAVTAATYYPIIEWIRDGVSLDGYLDRDSYEGYTEVRNPEHKAYLEALLDDAMTLRAILQACDQGTQDAFANVYGYTDAMFVEYLNIVIGYLEVYETTDMYDVLVFRMTHDETECYNGDPSLWGVKNYLSYPYTSNGEECPVDDEMLAAAAGYFNGVVGAMESYSIENVEQVFAANNNGEITFADAQNMRDELNKEVSYRGHEVTYVDYYAYFEAIRHERYNLVSFKSIVNVIETAGAKAQALRASYNNAVATFGEERAKQIYGTYPDTIDAFIASLYDILLKRSYDQHYALLEVAGDIDSVTGAFDGTQADEVDNSNFSAVKRAVKGIDNEVYEWVLANCSGATRDYIAQWHNYIPDYEAAAANVIAMAWSAFKQVQLDTPAGSGYYTTRYAEVGDMVREEYLDEDDYVVTEEKINAVIGKLDGFITSEAFTKLLGVYRETEEPELDEDGNPTGKMLPAVHTLSEYIENLLHDLLFQDELINTIVSALFPMLTELIGGLIGTLFQPDGPLADTGMLATPAAGADGAIDLGKLDVDAVDDLTGKINVHLDGNKGTAKLYNAFAELGLSFYPVTFAAVLEKSTNGKAGKYNALITNLKKAGEDWNNMDLYGGNADGELTVEDFEAYSWGVTDYDTFCVAIGDVFSSILPLLQVLFTNRTYNCTATNLIYGTSDSIYVKKIISATAENVTVWGDLHLALNGVQGYNNIWGTLFETLGVTATTSGYGIGQITAETPLSTTFGTSGASATAAQFANALFAPLLSLVDKVAEKPIDTVMSIIPNLMQSVAYDFVQPLLGALQTSIGITATLHDLSASGNFASWLIDLLQGTVCDLLSGIIDFSFDLNLGELLDLQELLGVEDLSDINGIIDHFLLPAEDEEAEGEGEPAAQAEGDEGEQSPTIDFTQISIPAINAGQWASLGSHQIVSSIRTQNLNDTTLSAGQRHTIVADKPDMLYAVINWLLEFAAGEGNVSGLLSTFGMSDLGEEVDAVLAGIDADDAVAALVELFLPQDYSLEDYHWYISNGEGSRYQLSSADFVYLKYANDWTREKADYLYNNIDSMANSIVNMIDPDMLADYNGNVNEYLLALVNGWFDNQGVMNVINLVVGIGEALKDQEMIVNLVKDQLSTGGADAGVDLLTWYRSFGYLTYDYTPKYDEETGDLIVDEYAPLKPTDPGYVNEFPALSVEVKETVNENGETVKEYAWSINGEALIDDSENAREVFTSIFCELFKPFSPIIGLLFTGTDLELFNKAIVINGAKCYEGAIIPVLEMLGIYDLKTQAEYEAAYLNDSAAGFEYLVNRLFDRVTELLTIESVMIDGALVELGPVQKVIDILPQLFYFIQSGGISTLLKNLLHPIWSLVDTIRPLVDVNLDAFLHQFLTSTLGLVYDKTDTTNYPSSAIVDLLFEALDLGGETPEYTAEQAAKDKDLVDGIFALSIEKLDLESIYFVVETMFGIDLSPLSYAIEGMCLPVERDGVTYGLKAYQSKTGKTAYTLEYHGADILTVLFSSIFDLILHGNNAAALDKLLGFVNEIVPGENGDGIASGITADGLVETLATILGDKADSMGEQPNWDYLLENKMVFGVDGETDIAKEWVDGDYQALQKYSDLSMYHSINNLQYLTDWTEDTAKATDELLNTVLDFVVTMIDEDATDFGVFVEELLMTEVFSADTIKMLVGLIADLFGMIPVEIISVIDTLLGVNLIKWADYVDYVEIIDEETGLGTGEYEFVAADLDWYSDPEAAAYIDTKEEFLDAIAEMLTPAAKLLGVIFLGTDYRLFHSVDNGPGSAHYGDDTLVINGLNAYAKGIVPIFEALGLDLSEYKPEKYHAGQDANGNMLYNEELFVSDFVHILSDFIDLLAEDPVLWLVDSLPGLIYFINADGLSVSVTNILDSLLGVVDIINTFLDEDQQIDLTNIEGIDAFHLDLGAIFSLISSLTGLVIRGDLQTYLKDLYVGQLKAYTSANGQTAFTMDYSAVEERHDMITILLALLLEIVTDEGEFIDDEGNIEYYNNAQVIDDMINGDDEEATDYVSSIVGVLKDPQSVIYKDINWNYFDEDFDLSKPDDDGKLLIPGYAFQYLNYTTDWTYQSAAKTSEGFSDLILAVLKMTGSADENATLSSALKEMLNLESVFTGETLQSLLDLVSPLLFGEDAVLNQTLIEVIGAVLGADLTQWNNEYAFESLKEGETYTVDAESGLQYRMVDIMEEVTDENGDVTLVATGEQVKTYAITSREEFITGSVILFQPAYRLLSWLLFGEDYEFFNGNTEATADDVLITIQGSNGYKEGLALLLEALGCTGLGFEAKYKTVDAEGNVTSVNMELFVKDLMTALFTRIDNILNDPANQLINLIPELLYFINAGGLQVSIGNLVAGPLNLVNAFAELTGDSSLNVDALLEDLLRDALDNEEFEFALDNINLAYIFEIVEMLTGLEVTDVVGNKLQYFHMGEIIPYASAGGKVAYKMRFSSTEDFADFITILLSFLVDVVLWDGNAAALEALLGLDDGLVSAIVAAVKESYTVKTVDIDWFYFDDTIDSENFEVVPGTTTVDLPDRTINYITGDYLNGNNLWNKETVDYIVQNRDEIISAVLSMTGSEATTVGEILSDSFSLNEDLYTAENLNSIITLVTDLVGGLDSALTDLVNVIINVDLSAYNNMPLFTEDQITDRASFVNGLYQVVRPIFRILDWLLFEDDIEFFDKKTEDGIETLISLPGGAGYAYAIVPLFEALGVALPAIKEGDKTEDLFYSFANNLLARVEAILANPVDEALALLPNLLYFINANGVSAVVNNLAGGILQLLDTVNTVLPEEDKISLEKFLADALGVAEEDINLDNLDLLYLVGVAEDATGLEITDMITEAKLDNFYLGQLKYYTSANGKPAFRMEYSATEGASEMLTVLVNFVLEVALYEDAETGVSNPAALEKLLDLDEGTIVDILEIIPTLGATPNYVDYNWNYMGGTVDAVTYDITLPKTAFINYFTYKTDVTQEVANYFYDNLDDLVLGIMRMCGEDETLEEMLAGSFNLYSADILNDLVGLTAELYELLDAKLIEVAGVLLDIDVAAWDGLVFTDAEIYDRDTFAAGLTQAIAPLFRILDWLLFGDTIELFVKHTDGTEALLTIAGNEGYKYGLAPLLEAIGVDLPTLLETPSCATMFRPVIDAVLERYDEIMGNLIDEALELLPNLLYFINANGLSVAVRNLAGPVLNVINVLNEKGIADIDISELLFGLDINNLDLEAVFTLLEELEVLGDFEFNNAFRGYMTENADGTVTFTRDVTGENIIKQFYIGDIDPYVSSTGDLAYRMKLTEESRGDIVCFILSFAVDAVLYGDNAGAIERKFDMDEGVIANIAAIFAQKMEFTPADFNWVYFLELSDEELDAALNNVLEGKFNELPALPERTLHYIEYDNNWTEDAADYLVSNLPDIVDLVIAMSTDYASLTEFINGSFNLYTNENVNMIVDALCDLLSNLDEYVLNHAGVLLNVEVEELMNFKATDVTDKASFVKALATAIGTMGEIVDLVLFGEDLELFTTLEDGSPALLTATGGEGYVNGLAPLLAALGVDTNIGTIPAVNGDLSITEQVIETILLRICDRVDEILANPVDEVVDLLLNLFYFINADGLTVAVNNLLQPATYIMEGLGLALGNDYSWNELFGNVVDINDLSFEGISAVLKDATGIDLWGAVGDYLGTFYFGELEYYEYAEGKGSFRMVYTEDEEAHDFITILLSIVLDTFVYEGNKDALVKLFGDDGEAIYNVIMAFLTDAEVEVPMRPYEWIFTDKADTGIVLSPVTGDGLYDYMYGELYTREMGEYITKWLPSFIDTMVVLLGVESPDGDIYDGLQDMLNELIGSTIYKTDLLVTIYDAISGLVADLKEGIGEELFTHLATLLNEILGVNLAYWDNYTVTEIAEGDKEAFINELLRMLTPVYPLLAFLLTDEDIAFFNKDDGIDGSVVSDENSYVIIHGAEGYAYGIIPILEAFGYDNDAILTPAEYKAAADGNPEELLRNILNPILSRVDAILADPIDELLGILPGVIYFVNSNGLDTAINNTINAVIRVLETIEPLTGEIDLYEIIGFDFDINIEGLIRQLLDGVAEDTGFELTEVAMEAITELTLGEVISFTSKNGDLAYTMKYATGADSVDFVTVILRLALTFISIPENVVALEAILADELTGDGYIFLCSLLENFSQMVAKEKGMDEVMYTVYQIFYAANVAAHKTNDWVEDFNGDYSFLNQLFATSDLAFLRQIESSLSGLLGKYAGDIVDEEGIAPNGFIKFFQKIAEFFQKIADFFANLFK